MNALHKSAPIITAVVISYNTADLTLQAVRSLQQSKKNTVNIVIIDNASTDGSVGKIMRRLKLESKPTPKITSAKDKSFIDLYASNSNLHLLSLRENLGFGRANNLGSNFLQADYYFFLNSDAEVTNTTIGTLIKLLQERPETGIIAPQLHNRDGSIQKQGGYLPTIGRLLRWIFMLDHVLPPHQWSHPYQHQLKHLRNIRNGHPRTVGWVGGTAMMIRKACWDDVNGFDPAIFMYGEDIDICWRAKNKNWLTQLAVAGNVIHLGSASSDSENALVGEIKGLLYLSTKFFTESDQKLLKLILKVGLRYRAVIFAILRRYGRQRAYQTALKLVG